MDTHSQFLVPIWQILVKRSWKLYLVFDQEGVNVVLWVTRVQFQLVSLYFCPNRVLQRFGVAEDVIVRPWQVSHQCWECVIKLFVWRGDLFSGCVFIQGQVKWPLWLVIVSEKVKWWSCILILLEPTWSLRGRPSQSGSSAYSGNFDHCSHTVSQTLSDRWCLPQRCLGAAQGQMAHLSRGCVFIT